MTALEIIQKIDTRILEYRDDDSYLGQGPSVEKIRSEIIQDETKNLDESLRLRVVSELEKLGPLGSLIQEPDITEILINSHQEIWIERSGTLSRHPDQFASSRSCERVIERILNQAKIHFNRENPTTNGRVELGPHSQWRLQVMGSDLTGDQTALSMRRQRDCPFEFSDYLGQGWMDQNSADILKTVLEKKLSFMVVGGTGTGKTTFMSSLLRTLPPNQRCVLLEDTQELNLPNASSLRLLSRRDENGVLKNIEMTDLLRHSLRLRPDRLVMGEIRSVEAKDFLMAISTGHGGSCATLHADSPAQALLRLEMLVQMGAPEWSLQAIRRLLQLSLQIIVVIKKDSDGRRGLGGIYQVRSLEESGFLVEKVESPRDLPVSL